MGRGRPAARGFDGETVVAGPMPSMPIRFWGAADGLRYHDAYFAWSPGVWRHCDWIRHWEDGSATIEGRSDATLNRAGVRIASADICEVVEALAGIADSKSCSDPRATWMTRISRGLRPSLVSGSCTCERRGPAA